VCPKVRQFDFATIEADCEWAGFARLNVRATPAGVLATPPRHHVDPFTQLLAAQASAEAMRLLAADQQFKIYGAAVEFVGRSPVHCLRPR